MKEHVTREQYLAAREICRQYGLQKKEKKRRKLVVFDKQNDTYTPYKTIKEACESLTINYITARILTRRNPDLLIYKRFRFAWEEVV